VKIALIAAIARNGVIGVRGGLPWHISDDLKRFKRLTRGHTVLMGRKTWESIGRPLVDRRNVVISSAPVEGAERYETPEAALTALEGTDLLFVIGGGSLYRYFLDRADALYLTLVDREVEGDTHFPPYDHLLGSRFVEVAREEHDGYRFVDYERASDK
jgi:dihydrofolate reductase